ncbi:MAG TPA: hypothetical protein VF342_16370 [Alphaproteobacteria bacterium]
MTRAIRFAALLAGVCLLGACTAPVPPTVQCDFTPQLGAIPPLGPALAEPTGGMRPVPLNTVSMTDPAITNKVMVQAVNASRTATGTVEIAARIVNCTDFPLQVEGRTHFLDKAQMPVEPVTAWQRVHLPARAFGVYRETSTDVTKVDSYLIEMREGR